MTRNRFNPIALLFVLLFAIANSPLAAQPVWEIAADEINAGAGDFNPGNPAQPGVNIETFGSLTVLGGQGGAYNDFDFDLEPELDIPAGIFDWGAAVEGLFDSADAGVVSSAGAFAIDGEQTSHLRVRWTVGATHDEPGPGMPRITGHAAITVLANARVRLTNLVPGAMYRVSWDWISSGAAASSTNFFNSGASSQLQIRRDGADVVASGNPISSNSIFVPGVVPMQFDDAGDGALTFVAPPGFTCSSEFLITVVASASVTGDQIPASVLGLATASAFGELNMDVTKLSVSFMERLGDANCDGIVNGRDVEAFVIKLLNEEQYGFQFPCCPSSNLDINLDGEITPDDIVDFAAILVNG